MTTDLRSAVAELQRALRYAKARGATLLRDLVAVDLASQVLNAAQATGTLHESETPEMGYATARTAFEAACDLLYLLTAAGDANLAAARAYVAAHVAARESLGLLAASGEAIGGDPGRAPEPVRQQIESDAVEIDTSLPSLGFGALMRAALADRIQGGEKHWSGLQRSKMISEIERATQDPQLGSMLRAYWAVVSQRAHARARLGERVHFTGSGIRIDLAPNHDDAGAISVAEASARTAAALLRQYLTGGSDDAHPTASM